MTNPPQPPFHEYCLLIDAGHFADDSTAGAEILASLCKVYADAKADERVRAESDLAETLLCSKCRSVVNDMHNRDRRGGAGKEPVARMDAAEAGAYERCLKDVLDELLKYERAENIGFAVAFVRGMMDAKRPAPSPTKEAS